MASGRQGRARTQVGWVSEIPALPVYGVFTEVVTASYHLRMFARRCGPPSAATTFVLVHGLGVSGSYMVPLMRELGPDSIAWAPDLPGFGRSPGPRAVLDVPELARALDAWIERSGIQRPVLVGNSMGCQIVTRLAVSRPLHVAGLVLIAPTMDRTIGGKWRQIMRWLLTANREPLAMVWLAIRDYLRAGFRRTWRTLTLARQARTWRLYHQVRCPTLVVRGERDLIVSQRWARRVAARLPGAQLAVVPAAAHAAHFDRPKHVASILRAFVLNASTP
jgi:2-hydroxy-6-oxonona-2,4-dienedioate hydrolase